ncbi:hypothetical protein Rhopal_002671-T1 [Rhodotorula paludigena]|uniref:RING-type domain-containing protein n=1 Tax=Rhodotorula paludigena TaxID=86838 RepID=A0AAV5GIB8_9BASI|nr:hypothetical protein Rhopal_002671-T1 [Rhodotorula paludigena]
MDASLRCLADPDCQACYLDDEARKFLDEPQFCPYAVTIDAGDAATALDCLNPDCARRTCLKCKHVDHGTTPCALANPSAVHRLEELMSDALIRKCPKCLRPYLKQDGCNRIICSTCKTMSCYLCQSVIKGYEHFNDEPGPCKGKLWKDKQILANVRFTLISNFRLPAKI